MAAPELRLNVTLDLGFFRQQLQKLTNIAQSEFAPKLNVKINRQTLDKELNHVSKMFARRDFRLQVNDTSIKAAHLNAQKLKNTLDLIAKTQYKVNVQGGGGKSFTEGSTGASGLFEYMRTQGLSGGGGATGVGRSARLQQALTDLTVKQLQALSKQEGIVGTSKLRKTPLIEKMMSELSQFAMERILGNAKMMLQNNFPNVATNGLSGRTLAAKVTGQMPLGSQLPALPPAGQTAAFSMGTMPSNLRQPSMPSTGMMGPSSQLSGGYLATGQALQGIQRSYNGVKSFFNTQKFPVTGAIAELGSEFGNAIKQVLLFGTAYKALAFLTSLPGEAFEAAKGLATYRNQLQAITSESGTFEQSFAFVDGLAARFNVPLDSARQGFVRLYASMQPAGFDQGQIENLFTGISKAAVTLGLSSDKVDRVTYAFSQMASKGQLMSEEVSGQLGDVIPGALSIMADAAQMDIKTFKKAMEDGVFVGKAFEQVMSNVPVVLEQRFGKGAESAAKTLQGAVNQIQNNLALMYQSFSPIVDGVAAAFGPQINALIKDVTDTVKILTGTFTEAGEGLDTLSPRAQGFYAAIQTLEPSLRQAGAAIADLGSRLTQLAPLFVEVLATAISFASSPLARAALLAAVAIGTLTAALKVLEVTGLKGALKAVYSFISSLAVGIPQATGVARVALIGLKLAVTGVFVGAILLGLDFLIGKILDIGGAAQKSIKDVKQLAIDLDRLTGAQDTIGLAIKRQEAENEVIVAERLLEIYQKVEKAGSKGYRALTSKQRQFLQEKGQKDPVRGVNVPVGPAIQEAERQLAAAMERRGLAQKSLETAQRLIEQEKARRDAEDKKLTTVDLSGEDDSKEKNKEASRINRYLQENLKLQTERGIIGKDELTQLEAKVELAQQIFLLEREDIKLNEKGKAQQLALNNAALAYQVIVAQANDDWQKATQRIEEVGLQVTEVTDKIMGLQSPERSPLQKALSDLKKEAIDNIQTLERLRKSIKELAGNRPEGKIASAGIDQAFALLNTQDPLLAASKRVTSDIVKDLQAKLKELNMSGKTLTTLDEVILKLGDDWNGLSPVIKTDITNLANQIDAAKPFAEMAAAIRDARQELEKMLKPQTMAISAAKTIGDAFGTAFKGIITGSMTAQEALANMFQSIADRFADMVAQMIAKWLETQVLQGFQTLFKAALPVLGAAAGGLSSGFGAGTSSAIDTGAAGWASSFATPLKFANGGIAPGGFTAFANGGVVTGPTLGLVGEGRYNEAVIPLPDGKSVPVQLSGGDGGNQMNTNITVNVSNGQAQSNASGSNSSELGRKIEGAVKQVIVGELRPGGLLASR
jgi:tape measure domain-containing protein